MSGATDLTPEDYELLLGILADWIAEGFTSHDSPLMRSAEKVRAKLLKDYTEARRALEHAPP